MFAVVARPVSLWIAYVSFKIQSFASYQISHLFHFKQFRNYKDTQYYHVLASLTRKLENANSQLKNCYPRQDHVSRLQDLVLTRTIAKLAWYLSEEGYREILVSALNAILCWLFGIVVSEFKLNWEKSLSDRLILAHCVGGGGVHAVVSQSGSGIWDSTTFLQSLAFCSSH